MRLFPLPLASALLKKVQTVKSKKRNSLTSFLSPIIVRITPPKSPTASSSRHAILGDGKGTHKMEGPIAECQTSKRAKFILSVYGVIRKTQRHYKSLPSLLMSAGAAASPLQWFLLRNPISRTTGKKGAPRSRCALSHASPFFPPRPSSLPLQRRVRRQ